MRKTPNRPAGAPRSNVQHPRDRLEKNPATPIGLAGDVAAERPRRHPGARSRPDPWEIASSAPKCWVRRNSRPDPVEDRSTGPIPAPEPPPPVEGRAATLPLRSDSTEKVAPAYF